VTDGTEGDAVNAFNLWPSRTILPLVEGHLVAPASQGYEETLLTAVE